MPQQPPEKVLQVDGSGLDEYRSTSQHDDEDEEVTILSYVDNSFEQDLSFIDG